MAMNTHGKQFDLTIEESRKDINGPAFSGAATNLVALTSSRMAPVSAELATFRNSLGWIDSVIVHRQTKKEAQKAVSNAYLQLIEAQGQLLLAKITMGLDAAKKHLLLESLKISGAFDREIQTLSTEFVSVVFDGVLEASIGAAAEETRKLQMIEVAHQAGRITTARVEQMREMATEATDHAIAIVKDTATRIIRVHMGKLEISLESFKERMLGHSA